MEKANKYIIGLAGYRCCGKSEVRKILLKSNCAVFDTNAVKTGDSDANQISFDEVIRRYGQNKSYLLYLENAIKDFMVASNDLIFIDSLKVKSDLEVLNHMLPDYTVLIWYLHASYKTRLKRYTERDIKTKIRSQSLDQHDLSLEDHGIWHLIKNSTEVINMEYSFKNIKLQLSQALSNINKSL